MKGGSILFIQMEGRFSCWAASSRAASSSSSSSFSSPSSLSSSCLVNVQGQVLSVRQMNGSSLLRLQVRCTEEPLPLVVAEHPSKDGGLGMFDVSIPSAAAASLVRPLDTMLIKGIGAKLANDGLVYLNAKSVERLVPWEEQRHAMMNSHVPLPLPPSGKGEPFILYGRDTPNDAEILAPGVHRVWTESSVKLSKEKNEERLEVRLDQRQWNTEEDALDELDPLPLKLTIWKNQMLPLCSKVDDMIPIMVANRIPFFAACRVDMGNTNNKEIALYVMGVQWDLKPYLLESCLPVSRSLVESMVVPSRPTRAEPHHSFLPPTPREAVTGTVVNVSLSGLIPPAKEDDDAAEDWVFYAMTNKPSEITSVELLESMFPGKCKAVLFAVLEPVATKKQHQKKSKKQKRSKD